jgi:alpha-tubulin suppressor-like RCC1 family protein
MRTALCSRNASTDPSAASGFSLSNASVGAALWLDSDGSANQSTRLCAVPTKALSIRADAGTFVSCNLTTYGASALSNGLTVSGNATMGGALAVSGTATFSNVNFVGALTSNGVPFVGGGGSATSASSNFCPASNNSYDLGSSTVFRWRNLYLAGGAISFADGATISASNWLYLQNYVLPPAAQATGAYGGTASNYVFSGSGQSSHSALIQNGRLYTFGDNTYGQLGQGNTGGYNVPTMVSVSSNATAVACGQAFTLVLNADGTAWGMGANTYGQLGASPTAVAAFSNPVAIYSGSLSNVTAVAAGSDFSLFLQSNGVVRGLGNNGRGQLGNGVTLAVNSNLSTMTMPAASNGSSAPTIAGFAPTSIACGSAHAVVVLKNGMAYVCGDNSSNQLGVSYGATASYATVPGLLTTVQSVAKAACGAFHTAVATTNGDVFTFGANDYGQLGLSNAVGPSTAPQLAFSYSNVATSNVAYTNNIGGYYALGAGQRHTVLGTNWSASNSPTYAWGDNSNGQLGLGTSAVGPYTFPQMMSSSYQAAQIGCGHSHTVMLSKNLNTFAACGNNASGQTVFPAVFPNAVGLTKKLMQSSANATHTAIIDADGTLYVCGNGGSGQLGVEFATGSTNFPTGGVSALMPVSMFDQRIVAVSASDHTAAVDAYGRVYAWGANTYGQIGNNTSGGNALVPIQISGLYGSLSSASVVVVAVACGSGHTVALDSTGKVHAWGYNAQGMIGRNNTTTPVIVPTLISGVYGSLASASVVVVAIACGAAHTVALDSTGNVHTWGYNFYGQLGKNTGGAGTDVYVPTLISGYYGSLASSSVVAIACGDFHTVALDSTGKVHTWGYNLAGQIGNNSVSTAIVPKQISGLYGSLTSSSVVVVAIACGVYLTVALDSTGKVHAWGYNAYGQIGIGTTGTGNYTPAVISGVYGSLTSASVFVVAIACGKYHVVALDSTGTVHTWGQNTNGQLGNNGAAANANVLVPTAISLTVRSPAVTNRYLSQGYGYHKLIRDVLQQGNTYMQGAGDNTYGQLGDSTTTYRYSSTSTTTATFASAIVASASSLFHSAVALSNGNVYAWGRNTYYECGLSTGGFVGSATGSLVSSVTAVDVACGTGVTLILTSTGTVAAMGTNLTGMLGNGGALTADTSASGPAVVSGLANIVAIRAGETFAVAVDSSGTLWCWGSNLYGQFGNGSTSAAVTTPVQILKSALGGFGVVDVGVGWGHTVVVNANHDVLSAGCNHLGQLGVATNAGTPNANSTFLRVTPFPPNAQGVACATYPAAVACGPHHTVVLLANGTIRTFGNNDRGQLGLPNGSSGMSATQYAWPPAPLTAATTALSGLTYGNGNYTASASPGPNSYMNFTPGTSGGFWIGATRYSTTAPYAPISGVSTTAGGTSYAGDWFQLQLPSAIVLNKFSLAVAASYTPPATIHVVGSNDGTTWTWLGTVGYNSLNTSSAYGMPGGMCYLPPSSTAYLYFRLIIGTLAGNSGTTAIGCIQLFSGSISSYVPVRPYQYRNVAFVSASVNTTYVEATLPRETVTYASDGTTQITGIFTKVRSYGLKEWGSGETVPMQGGTAQAHTGVVLKSGSLHLWGYTIYGQIGNGATTPNVFVPLKISGVYGSLTSANVAVTALSVAGLQTVALDSAGKVHTWGNNTYGQVGRNNTTTPVTTPLLISGVYGSLSSGSVVVVAISTGGNHMVAVDSTGKVHSWGYSGNGQLGNNTTTPNVLVPQVISGVYGSLIPSSVVVTAIACGDFHTAAVDSTGKVHMWGYNASGQIGNNSTTQANVPTVISGVYGSLLSSSVVVIAIACGSQHTVALDSAGRVHAWGINANGQIGNNTTTPNLLVPLLISTVYGSLANGASVAAIACGLQCTYALDTGGSLHVWGANASGQLVNNATAQLTVPTLNAYITNLTAVAGNTDSGMVVSNYGKVTTAGANAQGQLGNNTATASTLPLTITGAFGSLVAAAAGSLFFNFTGQHRCFVDGYSARTLPAIEGLVVCANKSSYVTTDAASGDWGFMTGARAITTNDALPVLSLSSKPRDKTAFGVVSLRTNYGGPAPDPTDAQLARQLEEGDQRAEINSVGEGAMWVCDAGGPLEAGDYVTTSPVPGYGMRQAEPYLVNFTVGKMTMDCDFNPALIPVLRRRLDGFGNNVTDGTTGMPVYDPVLTPQTSTTDPVTGETTIDLGGAPVLAPAYRTRYLASDGAQIAREAYDAAKASADPLVSASVYKAAFAGVTYHAG